MYPPPDPQRPMWDQLFEIGEPQRKQKPKLLIATVGAMALVAVVVLVAWLVWPAQPTTESSTAESPTPATEPSETVDPQAQTRLARLIPAGYRRDVCTPTAPPANAAAKVVCGQNTDPNGPPAATYTLADDKGALTAAFSNVVASSETVECPGRIQSPGPWRRNTTPQQVSGMLFCGTQQGKPVIAWTDDAELLLSEVRAGAQGPSFPQLYAWWSSHS